MRTLLCAIVMIGLSGCMVTPPKMVALPNLRVSPGSEFGDNATVYVFRQTAMMGGAVNVTVHLDGVEQGVLFKNQYVKFPAPAGLHHLALTWTPGSDFAGLATCLELSPNASYYFLYAPGGGYSGMRAGYMEFTFTQDLSQPTRDEALALAATYLQRPMVEERKLSQFAPCPSVEFAPKEITAYPFVATPERAALIEGNFARITKGMTPKEVWEILGEPDEIRPVYKPSTRQVVGNTYGYVLKRAKASGKDKEDSLVRITFGIANTVTAIDRR